MKTTLQNNAEQVGHYDFHPGSNEARILSRSPSAMAVMKVLFEAAGWQVVTHKPAKKLRKRAKKLPPVVSKTHGKRKQRYEPD